MKSFLALIVAILAAFVAVPASAQNRPAGCTERSNDLRCYDPPSGSASTYTYGQSQRRESQTPVSNFREPNASPEQVVLALNASRLAFRQCQLDIRADENRRGWNEAGQRVGVAIADRLIGGRNSYYGGSYYNSNNGYQSLQSCEQVRERVYEDMLRATPSSYCDESMVAEYRRGGQPVTEERMVRRCQARRNDGGNWSASFQPQE